MFTRSAFATVTSIAATAVALTVGASALATPAGAESPPDFVSVIANAIDKSAESASTVGLVEDRPDFTAVGGFAVRPVEPTSPGPSGPSDWATPTVAGAAIEHGPAVGRPLIIVGIAPDDVLDFRIAPSPTADIAVSYPLALTEFDMYALGEAWQAPSGIWWKVNVMGTDAWVRHEFIGVRGGSEPIFDTVASELQILMFGSIDELAMDVASTRGIEGSRIVVITEPVITALGDGGGNGHVFVDVLDVGDDVKLGERLRVEFSVVYNEDTPEPDDIGFVVLTGVEMILIQAS